MPSAFFGERLPGEVRSAGSGGQWGNGGIRRCAGVFCPRPSGGLLIESSKKIHMLCQPAPSRPFRPFPRLRRRVKKKSRKDGGQGENLGHEVIPSLRAQLSQGNRNRPVPWWYLSPYAQSPMPVLSLEHPARGGALKNNQCPNTTARIGDF